MLRAIIFLASHESIGILPSMVSRGRLERLAAEHRVGVLGGHLGPWARLVVPALDQQPLGLLPVACPLQGKAAPQLLAVEDEDRMTALQSLRPRHTATLLVATPVPDDHPAAADLALETVVGERVVLDLDREPLDGRIHRRPLGHCPGAHLAADLEPQVEVMRGGSMLLDDEDAGADPADRELLVALDLDGLDIHACHA